VLGHKNTERHFSSGGNIEEIIHESYLSANVAFPDSFNLSLPDHVHDFVSSNGPPRRMETEEAESGIDSAFYESVILLDYVIEIFAAAQLSGDGQDSLLLQVLDRGRVGPVLIDVDDPWVLMFGGLQHFAKESFGGPRVSFCAEHKVNHLACGIHRTVEVVAT
jgi:hypothetical protein